MPLIPADEVPKGNIKGIDYGATISLILDHSLPGEGPDFHTLGGYLMARLNRVPMVADRVTAGDWRFEIVEMDGRRVDRVLVAPVTPQE